MLCPKCGADIGENKVCQECGEKIVPNEAEVVVSDSENQVKSEENVQNEEKVIAPENDNYSENADLKPKKSGKKTVIIVVAVLAVLAIVAGLIFALSKKSTGSKAEDKNYTFFIKDNSAYYLDPKEDKPVLITDSALKNEKDNNWSKILYANFYKFADNDKKIFYAENADLENDSFTLYYKMLNKPEEDPVKLAENVKKYSASDDGKTVIYQDTEGNLYRHNMTDREKILSEVDDYYISSDCLSIAYLSEDGGLYCQVLDGEKDKIDFDVDSIEDISEDLKTIYYLKDGTLYTKKDGSDKAKIDSDVVDTVVLDNGDVYFTKSNKEEKTLADFIVYTDEKQKSDTAITSVSTISDCKTYNESMYRLEAYKILKEKTIDISTSSLYYYDGEKVDLVNASYSDKISTGDDAFIIGSYDNVNVKPVTIEDFINTLDSQEGFRAKVLDTEYYNSSFYNYTFSEYEYFDEFEKVVTGAYETDKSAYLIKNGAAISLEAKSGSNFILSDDGSSIYYYANKDEEKATADINVIKIADNKVAEDIIYDTEVSTEYQMRYNDSKLVYCKDFKDSTYDLYIDKQLVEYDVCGYQVLENDSVLYYTDKNEDTKTYTLYVYSNGEKVKIADDCVFGAEDQNGNILYYANYSEKNDKGDLYSWANGETAKIDYDVCEVMTINNSDLYRSFITYSAFLKVLDISWD